MSKNAPGKRKSDNGQAKVRMENVYVGGPWKDRATADANGAGIAERTKGAVYTVSRWGKAKRYYVTVKAPAPKGGA